jgi:hypothetical protein
MKAISLWEPWVRGKQGLFDVPEEAVCKEARKPGEEGVK